MMNEFTRLSNVRELQDDEVCEHCAERGDGMWAGGMWENSRKEFQGRDSKRLAAMP